MPEPNPYLTPASTPESRKVSTPCPVCGGALNRFRMIFPFARCHTCHRRIRLRNSTLASSLSTLTAIACFVSLLQFEATPDSNGRIFAIHALVFLALGTLWFQLFGRLSLAGWIGNASPAALARERDAFRVEASKTDR